MTIRLTLLRGRCRSYDCVGQSLERVAAFIAVQIWTSYNLTTEMSYFSYPLFLYSRWFRWVEEQQDKH